MILFLSPLQNYIENYQMALEISRNSAIIKIAIYCYPWAIITKACACWQSFSTCPSHQYESKNDKVTCRINHIFFHRLCPLVKMSHQHIHLSNSFLQRHHTKTKQKFVYTCPRPSRVPSTPANKRTCSVVFLMLFSHISKTKRAADMHLSWLRRTNKKQGDTACHTKTSRPPTPSHDHPSIPASASKLLASRSGWM